MTNADILVSEDPAEALAEQLADAVRAGRSIALSGGSSPRRAYERAASLEPDWSRCELWFVDDRCVPPEDERSNYLLAKQTILDVVEQPPAAVHRIEGEREPAEAADLYDRALADARVDLAVMGIGPDGHTASLFPRAPTLDEAERRAVWAEAGLEPFVPRVTMTIPFLAQAEHMVFLVTGAEKADAAGRAFGLEPSPETPASLVRGRRTVALLDAAAASRLHP